MDSPLRALILEDHVLDYELLLRALRRDGYVPEAIRVETEPEFQKAIATAQYDVILADYSLPRFDAMRALDLVQAQGLDVPFIVVTGSIGEEQAVACMRRGAADYLLKDRLARLGSAVAHALEERKLRLEKTAAVGSLHERENRFRALLERSSDIIALLNQDGTVRYVSPSIERVLGYTPDEMIGLSAAVFCSAEAWGPIAAKLSLAENAPESSTTFEICVWHKDGTPRTLDVTLTNMLHDPAVGGIVGNAHDVTDRIDLENRFRHAQKMEAIGRLAGKIAHDFKNHLTVINGYSQMTLLDLEPDHPVAELVQEAFAAGKRAADLAQKLLTFSRREDTEEEVFDLNRRVRETTGMLSQLIAESVTLRAEIADQPAWVATDPAHLDQVLMNLAVNASDAMPEGGTLTIRTGTAYRSQSDLDNHWEVQAKPGRYVELRMSDTGVGMTQDIVDHLFEPFFTTKDAGKGTGLGLATVYGMVTGAGGFIEVQTKPGQGSTFGVYWPELPAPSAQQHPIDTAADKVAGSETLLVVEDELAVLSLVRSVLRRLGYRVFEAHAADEALGLIRTIPVDLVLTDVVMPGLSGPDLVAQMRQTLPNVRAVYMSGYTGDDLLDHGMNSLVGPLIRKPFTPDQLGRTVRLALDSKP